MTTLQDCALANLRRSIDALPERTRRAMLSGIDGNTVITGAFSDGSGVCPMLAAHREGDRVRCMSFPEAWDRFTGVHGRCITRPASKQEVLTLKMQLEESLEVRAFGGEFAAVIAEHEATVAANRQHAAAQAEVAAHEALVAARQAEREAARKDEERRERRRRESDGFVADFSGAIREHLAIARDRRGREATQTGLDWLFEETLVLPEDFDRDVAPEPEHSEEFDFSQEPATVVPPARTRGRSILK
jgi:hypothetical protein